MSLLALAVGARGLGAYVGGGGGGNSDFPTDPNFPTVSAQWSDIAADTAACCTSHVTYGNNSAGQPNAYQQAGFGKAAGNPTIIEAFQRLGIRHFREQGGTNSASLRSKATAISQATGAKLMLTAGYLSASHPLPSVSTVLAEVAAYTAGVIEYVEGPNEPSGVSDWPTKIIAFMQALYPGIGGAYPVLTPPLAWYTGSTATGTGYNKFSGQPLNAYSDIVSLHPYPGGGDPAGRIDTFMAASKTMATGKPFIDSETGYHNATASTDDHFAAPEDVAGVYYPRLILESIARGVRHAYAYELVDQYRDDGLTDKEKHFGLFGYGPQTAAGWYAKLAAIALGRWIRLHADVGGGYTRAAPFQPDGLQFKVGGSSDVRYRLFGKQDGSYVIDVWRDVQIYKPAKGGGTRLTVTPQPITVTFPGAVQVARHQVSTPPAAGDATPFVSKPVATATGAAHTFNVAGDVHTLVVTPVVDLSKPAPTQRPAGNILFNGDLSTGDASQWDVQKNPTATVTVYSASSRPNGGSEQPSQAPAPPTGRLYAAKLYVDGNDNTPNTANVRAQLFGSSHLFQQGDEAYFPFSVWFPTGFPVIDGTTSGEYFSFMETFGPPFNGSPNGNLMVAADNHNGVNHLVMRYSDGREKWYGPVLETGRWHDFIVRKKFSQDPAVGFIELWHDDVQQTFVDNTNRWYVATQTPGEATSAYILQNYFKRYAHANITLYVAGGWAADTLELARWLLKGGSAGAGGSSSVTNPPPTLIPGNLWSLNQQSVETDLTGFAAANSNTTISRTTEAAYDGTASLKVTATASGNAEFRLDEAAIAPSTAYTVTMRVKPAAGSTIRSGQFFANVADSAGNYVATLTGPTYSMGADWTQITWAIPAGSGSGQLGSTAGRISIVVDAYGAAAGESYLFDRMSLVAT